MAKVRIPYYVVKNGNGFWQPNKRMRQLGFMARTCGPDGPAAWKRAWGYYQDWQDCRSGRTEPTKYVYPRGSFGEAWERYLRTAVWAEKAKATRDEWDYVWGYIEPIFGDVAPDTVTLDMISALQAHVLETKSLHAAHRLIKVWRAFWKIMAAMKYCRRDADPSKGIRNRAPKGRSETWKEGEAVRLTKTAWRMGYHGLAAGIAVIWDTQFSPGDARALTAGQMLKDRNGTYFDQSRAKTGKDALGTLSRRSERLLEAYLRSLPFKLHGEAPIFRNRSGAPYTKDTFGDDFREVREATFPGDKRKLMDMRRSGAVEADAGDASAEAMQRKMANSLATSKKLQDTYLPKKVARVRQVDRARIAGRKHLRENE